MAKRLESKNCEDCHCKTHVFTKLTEFELDLMHQDRFQVAYNAGEIIFKQGSPSTYMLCLTSGLVKVYIEGLGKNLILSVVKPVEYIIAPGLYADNRHHFSVAALVDATACLINVSVFKQLIRQNQDLAEEFMQRLSNQMIDNFDHTVGLTQKQMPGRIADAILYLSERIFGTDSFDMIFSRQELADFSGMSTESAIRILKEFKDEGIVEIKKDHVSILDFERLKRIQETG
jgi:CRP/FNR family transcriptional regulator, polysaccharide utilization system transcription regulator